MRGKNTTVVLGDGFNAIEENTALCIREPSLGHCFGLKGGLASGGYAHVILIEDMNLYYTYFTGDFHEINLVHNLLEAMLDNQIFWRNALEIDACPAAYRRAIDMSNRAPPGVVCNLGRVANGFQREAGFDITVAFEVMAILCPAEDLMILKNVWRKNCRLSTRAVAGLCA